MWFLYNFNIFHVKSIKIKSKHILPYFFLFIFSNIRRISKSDPSPNSYLTNIVKISVSKSLFAKENESKYESTYICSISDLFAPLILIFSQTSWTCSILKKPRPEEQCIDEKKTGTEAF